MVECIHHWLISDNEIAHQIGTCSNCGEQRDYGINPAIITPKYIITTNYFLDPSHSELREYKTIMEREYQYPNPPKGFCVPFEQF